MNIKCFDADSSEVLEKRIQAWLDSGAYVIESISQSLLMRGASVNIYVSIFYTIAEEQEEHDAMG
jgi:hypothetical protein